MSLRFIFAGLAWALALNIAQAQPAPGSQARYDSLYAKAYHIGKHHPDSAIHYARLALEATTQSTPKGNAHNLFAFYAQRQGYYGAAIQHYRSAYDLYTTPAQKASALKKIAFCYINADNYRQAIPIARKAVQNFSNLGATTRLVEALNLLANCYNDQGNFGDADSTFKKAIALAHAHAKSKLPNIYGDLARLKEKQQQYDSAAHYQRRALERFPNPDLRKKCIRLARLGWYYILSEDSKQARRCIDAARRLKQYEGESSIVLQAVHGFLLFVERKETQARQAIRRSDSLLKRLRAHSAHPLQQKYTRKLAYEINASGYKILRRLSFYSSQRARFAPHQQWFADRMRHEKQLLDQIKVNVQLKDSLIIERTQPKTELKIINKVSLWWWVIIVAALVIGVIWVYKARTQKLRAEAQRVQARTDLVKAIETSPIKGFENLSDYETQIIHKAEDRLRRKATADEIKLLVWVARKYTYNQIAVNLGIREDTVKTRIKRLRQRCGVDNIRDLM